MADTVAVDTSSYPKFGQQKSPLEVAGQYQGLERNAIGIDKAKLDLVNQRYDYLLRELNSVSPDLPPDQMSDQMRKVGLNAVKMKLIPPEMYGEMVRQMPTDLNQMPAYRDSVVSRVLHGKEAVNFQYGQEGLINNGAGQVPVVTSPRFGIRQTGQPIVTQPSKTQLNAPMPRYNTETGATDVGTTEQFIRDTGGEPGGPPVVAPVAPQVRGLPVASPQAQTAPVAPALAQPRLPVASTSPVGRTALPGAPPTLGSDVEQLKQDRELSTQKLTALKPAQQALAMMPGLRSGPGTAQWNQAVAFLKANNIVPTGAKDDPTVIYQEVSKKLADYLSSNPIGQRSDAAQTLREAASPSPKTQLNPALIKLTRDAIALDRVQAARANAYEGEGPGYSKFRSSFPQQVDERAFSLDVMPPEERNKLVLTMKKKYDDSKGKDKEATKFFKSLEMADKQGFMDIKQ